METKKDAPSTKHSSSDVWNRLNQQSDQIADLTGTVREIGANVSAMVGAFERNSDLHTRSIAQLTEQISEVRQDTNRPTNWLGIGALFATSIGGLITFNALQTDPVRNRSVENSVAIEELHKRELEQSYQNGQHNAKIDILLADQRRFEEFMLEAQFLNGQQEEIGKRVESIDEQGSRVWNKAKSGGKND